MRFRVLLYGPPGTGKTTVVRWLASELAGYTKLIVAGTDYLLLQDTLQMARVLFVLTTNRPEVLEPALAARPGRVDQAIEIGLPSESERALLVRRYAGALRVDDAAAVHAARRLGPVSPAFIKELMRRAAQAMLERGGGEIIEKRDVESAIGDMLAGRTRRRTHVRSRERDRVYGEGGAASGGVAIISERLLITTRICSCTA
ncbi:MAG TPA: AAA family ATPase [Burkholderiales bacterium]|nr:AAA family ATPase [Burkholderiales bacterium]